MSALTVMDNEAMSLWIHPEFKIVHHKMKRTLLLEEFQILFSMGAELLEQYHAAKWLSDDRGDG
jgi:hypothetical protein